MKRIIFGISIILFGVLILLGVAYYLFFADKYPIEDIISRFTKPDVIETEIVNTEEVAEDPTNIDPVDTPENNEGDSRRIVVVDNGLTQNNTAAPREFNKDDLVRMAGSFAERFGSFSNQSNFANILDLKIFMSEKMKRWADNYVEEQRKKQTSDDIYYGINTRAIYKELIEYDDDVGRAKVRVSTRRKESTISTENVSSSFNQDIEILFIKENEIWKVDDAFWQKQ